MFTRLENYTLNNTELFHIPKRLVKCKVVKVTDGDTVKLIFKPYFFSKYYYFNVRLIGFDANEVRTRDPVEKEKGLELKKELEILISDKIVYLLCDNFDCFGRLLGTIYLDSKKSTNINNIMKKKTKNLNGIPNDLSTLLPL
jgi:endonuclease YncB( thermonuclease family)